jgi:hypothetical protein
MYGEESFQNYMRTSHTIKNGTRIIAEWNMNIPGNIQSIGNYEVRAGNLAESSPNALDSNTIITTQYYQEGSSTPTKFTDKRERMRLMYSLEDCLNPDRPRSGINKPLYLGYTASDTASAQYINNYGSAVAERPRYYMGSRFDPFKYWTSYRVDVTGEERGISREDLTIDDVAPFVIYKNAVPANRIVIKMQTNVGSVNQGPFRIGDDEIPDPLYGSDNATVPSVWSVQLRQSGVWNTVATLSDSDITHEGYVELAYGYTLGDDVNIKGVMPTTLALPNTAQEGDTYWVESTNSYYKYNRPSWTEVTATQTWGTIDEELRDRTPVVNNLIKNEVTDDELQYIEGIRIVVTSMNKPNQTFDLIEMSPRLVTDITDRVVTFNISKILGDLGNAALPVGDLLASTGSMTINNNDAAFSYENQNSILCITQNGSVVDSVLQTKMKIRFYDVVKDVIVTDENSFGQIVTEEQNIHIPIKTLYSEGFPQSTNSFDVINMQMRDKYSYLEQETAPQLFLQDISLSFAIVMLLDYIGFTNYKFYRMPGEQDDIIPFFFVSPGKNVAQILQELATATQSAMWFDEKNNLCVGTREWLLSNSRETAGVLRANNADNGLANVVSVASSEKKVVNDGSIQFIERYIQREQSALKQAYNTARWKNWSYKPVPLWEISADENLRTYNTASKNGSLYALSALPLAEDLTAQHPAIVGGEIVNNVMEFGEGISWLGRANGYFHANGEIIRFDAIEFAVSGLGVRWVTDNDDYQAYLADLPFGGKIYATGRVRIWAEPTYDENGNYVSITAHGRGQFGTKIVEHKAGLNEHWTNNSNTYGLQMDSSYLYSPDHIRKYPLDMNNAITGMSEDVHVNARNSDRTSVIKNFLADTYQVEAENERFNTTNRGTVQASSYVFTGPKEFLDRGTEQARVADNLTYTMKDFGAEAPYHHFGTRMRIIGEILSNSNTKQTAVGQSEYVTLQPDNPSEQVNIVGGGGGLAIQVDPTVSSGYFLELVALSEDTNPKSPANPTFNATVTMSSDRGTSKVVISTGVEHNIDQGDKFVVTYSGSDPSLTNLKGEWTAEGVDQKAGKINIRIDGENNYNGAETVKVQKIGAGAVTLSNIFFYKMQEKYGELIPYVLWEGMGEILVNDGKFTEVQRVATNSKETVYDLGVEFKDETNKRTFYLYINGNQIATVTDTDPIMAPRNTMAMFVRGKSKCMFSNVYALTERISENPSANAVNNISEVFGTGSINQTEALRKYGVSGFVRDSYLSGIKTEGAPDYQMYFDEFGTIMRECAYIKAKYDQAYPALAAVLAPTLNNTKGYSISGFMAGAYEAEFLIFNNTDTALQLDPESGNFVKIIGVAFTQDTSKTLSVDDYYGKIGDLSKLIDADTNESPQEYREKYNQIITSRSKYGLQQFDNITSDYIQDTAQAENMIGWIMSKTMRPRQTLGISPFGLQHVELGDIFTLDYKVLDSIDAVSDENKKFVTYQVDYSKNESGLTMSMYLVEV